MNQKPDARSLGLSSITEGLDNITITRRSILRTGLGLGATFTLGSLLAACADSDDDGADPSDPSDEPEPEDTEEDEEMDDEEDGDDEEDEPVEEVDDSDDEEVEDTQDEEAADGQAGGTLRLALALEPDSADPHFLLTTEAFRIVEQIYSTLVVTDNDLNIDPDLAESWEVDDDATHFRFELRSGVMFHHGRELTAADVEYSARRLDDGSPYEYIFIGLDEITVVDDYTIEFSFTDSAAHFVASMTPRWTAIVAEETVEEGGETGLQTIASGTGPFKLVDWNPMQQVVIERNDDYFEEGLPYLDEIIWTPVPDETSRVNQIVSGTMDLDIDGPARLYGTYESAEDIEIIEGPVVSFVYAGLNTQRAPFDQVEVRQAVAWAINRQEIVDLAANGRGVPLNGGFIGPEGHWAFSDLEVYPEPDLDMARELLEQAGVTDEIEVVLVTVAGTTFANIAQIIQQQLEPIGIRVTIDAIESGAANDRVFSQGDFDMTVRRWGTMIDPHDFTGEFFYSDGAYNFPGLDDPELDALLDSGIATPDEDERREIYREVEEYLVRDVVPYVFLYRPTSFAAFHEDLQGLEHESANSRISLKKVWLDR
jgi:peptide/nickel transport system substrate-binding protein